MKEDEMRRFHLAFGILPRAATVVLSGCFATAAILAGCGGQPFENGQGDNAMGPSAAMRTLSMTMVHYVQPVVHTDRGQSWMLPQKNSAKTALIYSGDDSTDDVYVYDYSSGKLVGTLTGFSLPYGMCVDAKGDVYIANFGEGNAVEYAHGGTRVLNTYDSGGEPMGCSVDSKGDVAVTNFDPGEVTVFAGGDPTKGTTYSGTCYYLWTMGYDHKGNLIGVGENGAGDREYCGLLAKGTSITSLSFSGTIDFPGGTMWDGKYIALTDTKAGGKFQTGIIEVSLSSSTLTSHGEAILTCESGYTEMVNPFVVGKKNTPINDHRGEVVAGPGCGSIGIGLWHYPKGGDPFKSYSGENPYGAAVSLGT
jgi:hypothetical protein